MKIKDRATEICPTVALRRVQVAKGFPMKGELQFVDANACD